MSIQYGMQGNTDGIINVAFDNKESLYKAFMPFVKNGGLFISTSKQFSLGDELSIALSFPEQVEPIRVSCKVVWITPVAAEGNRSPGIGLQFCDSGNAKNRIENCLCGLLKSENATHTM